MVFIVLFLVLFPLKSTDSKSDEFGPFLDCMSQDTNDVLTISTMKNQPDADKFYLDMRTELQDQIRRDHWTMIPSSSVPINTKLITSIWDFKRKLSPDGVILKYKYLICDDGRHQQWGINYWETYAPVVNWITIWTMLILSLINLLHSRVIDFTLAFPQAELNVDIYMLLPEGYNMVSNNTSGKVLKIHLNLYGLKQDALTWFQTLKLALLTRGFRQYPSDPCLFIKSTLIFLIYVDDCLLFSPSLSDINYIITSLQSGSEKFYIYDQGSASSYLGISIKLTDTTLHLSQPHLITRFLQLLKIDDNSTYQCTPEILPLLHRDEHGESRKHSWSYPKAIGIINYIQTISRPDISMDVHQTSRFSIYPKRSHEKAIIRIGKYLLQTRNNGIIYSPNISQGID